MFRAGYIILCVCEHYLLKKTTYWRDHETKPEHALRKKYFKLDGYHLSSKFDLTKIYVPHVRITLSFHLFHGAPSLSSSTVDLYRKHP